MDSLEVRCASHETFAVEIKEIFAQIRFYHVSLLKWEYIVCASYGSIILYEWCTED